jgi:uncharacterized protein (DUF58 family)
VQTDAARATLRFDDAFLQKLEYLRIVSRKAFAGRDRADRLSRARGRGIQFADHRPYTAGDDIRHIDWKAYRRLNRLLLRLFDEEQDLPVYVFIDTSQSMAGAGKFDQARRVAAALCYIGLVHLDRIILASFTGHMGPEIVPGRGRARIVHVFDRLEHLEPGGTTDFYNTFKQFAARSRPRGVAVVISDFLDAEGVQPGLRMLASRGHDVFAVHVASTRDRQISALGDVQFVDAESGETRDIDLSPGLAAAYLRAWERQADELRSFCTSYQLAYVQADADEPFEDVILRTFREGGFLS